MATKGSAAVTMYAGVNSDPLHAGTEMRPAMAMKSPAITSQVKDVSDVLTSTRVSAVPAIGRIADPTQTQVATSVTLFHVSRTAHHLLGLYQLARSVALAGLSEGFLQGIENIVVI